MRGNYLDLGDVCKLVGKVPTEINRKRLAREVRLRIVAAKGKLDRYDPRHYTGKHGDRPVYRFTQVSLKYIFPEFYDRRDEVEKRLAAQFKEIQRMIDELDAKIAREAKVRRGADDLLVKAIGDLRGKVGRSAA